jgi:hypothetical protein
MGPRAGRYGQKPPAENARVHRVRSGSQDRQDRTCQDGDDKVKPILSPADRESAEFYETAERCGIGGQKPEAQAQGSDGDGEEDPKRGHESPVSGSIYEEAGGDGDP